MLGSGLSMTGSVLSVNASTAVPPATSSSLGTVQLAGSLTGAAVHPLGNNSVRAQVKFLQVQLEATQ